MEYRTHLEQIDECFRTLTGDHLPCPPGIVDRWQWLHEQAPYSILAHHAGKDPIFFYANQYALACFKFTEEEMLSLPSRLSAGPQDRAERERLLKGVTEKGIAFDYIGPRVDKFGKSFIIYDGVVWQLQSPQRGMWGQAALFWTTEHARPGELVRPGGGR